MTNSSQPELPASGTPEPEEGGQMTFFEHLVELRKRLIHSLIAIGIGAFIGVYISKYVIVFVTRPMMAALKAANLHQQLVYTHPAGGFNLILTLGIYIGLAVLTWGFLRKYYPVSRFWPMQLVEGGWLLALSVLLIAATVWLVRRRTA